MKLDELKKQEHEYAMHTYGRFDAAFEHGEGCRLYDYEGREYIDFTSGIGVTSIGYGNTRWIEAVSKQAASLQHVSNLYYTEPAIELARRLCELSGHSKVFLCNSGAEANECATKLARKYSFDKYGPGRSNIITLNNSFHGRTITTLAMTGQEKYHKFFSPFTDGFIYADPNIEDCKAHMDEKTCAVLLEGIQGEGGVVPLDGKFVAELCGYCAERDILVIFDEVQTGIGRTGRLFSYEWFGVRPDIVTSAKGLGGGLPIGAVLCNEKLSEVFQPGDHGSTFGGNPVVCAGANVVLGIVGNDEFLEDVCKKGEYITGRIRALDGVSGVRGKGLMIGIALESIDAAVFARACLKNGLAVLTAKSHVRLLPPLTITREEIDKGLEIFEKTLKKLSEEK